MRNHDTAAHHQRDIERLFLFHPRHTQTVRLNGVVENAIVAAQGCGCGKAHQLFGFRWQSTFQIGVVVDVVEALDQEIIRLIDARVEALPSVQELAREFALLGDVSLGEQVRGFLALRTLLS